MRKKKALKNLSNEIFDNDNKEKSHDIFADKENLIIEDTKSTPKLEEEHNIELDEINNILQDSLNGKDEEVEKEDTLLNKPEEKSVFNDEDNNNQETINEEVVLNDNIEDSNIEDSNIEEDGLLENDEDDFTSLNDLNEKISDDLEEDKTSLNDLNNELEEKEMVDDLTDQMEKDVQEEIVMPEIDEDIEVDESKKIDEQTFNDYDIENSKEHEMDDDTTFNELKERTDKNGVKDEQIISNFPRIEKFGIVVPNK